MRNTRICAIRKTCLFFNVSVDKESHVLHEEIMTVLNQKIHNEVFRRFNRGMHSFLMGPLLPTPINSLYVMKRKLGGCILNSVQLERNTVFLNNNALEFLQIID